MESVRPKTTSATSFSVPEATKSNPTYVPAMPFGKANFQLMIAGIVTILIGFFVMTIDTEPFGFGFFGLTLGPIIVTAGFLIEFVAILKKPTESAK